MKRIKLTRKGFREWLEGKLGETIVGYTRSSGWCPIAHYLRQAGVESPLVGENMFRVSLGKKKPLPPWAILFVAKIDATPFNITARKALTVLDGKEHTDG